MHRITAVTKLGRPVEIDADRLIGIRLPAALLERIDAWARAQKVGSRSAAVRVLLEKAME